MSDEAKEFIERVLQYTNPLMADKVKDPNVLRWEMSNIRDKALKALSALEAVRGDGKIGKCFCEGIEAQTYENQVVLDIPDNITIHKNTPDREVRKQVSVDACLVGEIKYLWRKGIRTTGCCCGHNKHPHAYIGVYEEDIPKMKALGYETAPNPMDKTREDSFIPKSLKLDKPHPPKGFYAEPKAKEEMMIANLTDLAVWMREQGIEVPNGDVTEAILRLKAESPKDHIVIEREKVPEGLSNALSEIAETLRLGIDEVMDGESWQIIHEAAALVAQDGEG